MPEKYRQEKENQILYISSQKGEKDTTQTNIPILHNPRKNDIIDFKEREKVFIDNNPKFTIDIVDSNGKDGEDRGVCYIYKNPRITNNDKKSETFQVQKGYTCIYEPVAGDKTTKIFFIPEDILDGEQNINKIIKEFLELPTNDFYNKDGTASIIHTKLDSFRDSINFYLTGKKARSLTSFKNSSERIQKLYMDNSLDVGYVPRTSSEIAQIADGEIPDRTAINNIKTNDIGDK